MRIIRHMLRALAFDLFGLLHHGVMPNRWRWPGGAINPPINFNILEKIIMFCKHKWEVKHESLTPSFLERADVNHTKGVFLGMTQSTKIVIMACEKCGKVDKTIEKV